MSRHAVVTGASSGIGQAIAEKLLSEGWKVTGLSRSKVEHENPNFVSQTVDLFDTDSLISRLENLPPVDAVIHAAGKMVAAPLGELNIEESQSVWHLHVHVAEILANHFATKLGDGGRIVIIGSRTSKGVAGRSQYVATKSALFGMVRSWAAELAPKGITANIIAPGATETPMLLNPDRKSSPPKLPPMGRFISPYEVAEYVKFILSPHASAITGQELVMCGGASL
ncbi:SDR family NAD(P)-dependent oxidoreductase [Vibrio sp. YYF0003]|uniref:SDR family NAD(P)-dependent oxidoreductase n=1 Tax=Vibrio sp. YYF0003 TaxID=3116646 RepID=UPI002E9B6C1F|nr:SDR family oxidoreductase [Vibrio sp. YYF0003]